MARNGRNPKSPAYQWYPSDAAIDLDYRLLDDAEKGNFHDLLDVAWMNDGIPDDIESIASLLGRSVAVMRKRWKRLGKCWAPHPSIPNRLVNNRQERERTSQVENRERRKAAAEAANAARWSESDTNRTKIGPESESDRVAPVSRTPSPVSRRPAKVAAQPRAVPETPHHQFIAWWTEAFQSATGQPYGFRGGRDGKHVQGILDQAGGSLEKAKERALVLLHCAPEWIDKGGKDLGTLDSQWNKLVSQQTGAATGSKIAAIAPTNGQLSIPETSGLYPVKRLK